MESPRPKGVTGALPPFFEGIRLLMEERMERSNSYEWGMGTFREEYDMEGNSWRGPPELLHTERNATTKHVTSHMRFVRVNMLFHQLSRPNTLARR
ncbi:hypothetical protein EVAR_2736_1 [Eumeta japonica]|uniref:Uncharacterized protein n=1 Tax=Eumeta variegata TaxID=151549 RepID=A0A4C1T2V6_EUMVA|nr:hypothetical protein EVAR_2736_1 [Eumeta japonica]